MKEIDSKYYGGMKQQYNLITIKFRIPKTESIKSLTHYKDLIRSFRNLKDLGALEVIHFDNQEIEELLTDEDGHIKAGYRVIGNIHENKELLEEE